MKKTYKVILEKRVSKKDLRAIPEKDRRRVLQRIKSLANDPYPKGYAKLENYKVLTYRIRQGNYRILYRVHDTVLEILVIEVGHRQGVYKQR